MSRIRIHKESELEWVVPGSNLTDDEKEKYVEENLNAITKLRVREEGSETSPQLIELSFCPNKHIELHAHDEDEIIYVVSGHLTLGRKILGQGASLFIAGNTLYKFSSGPEGLQILNFRARRDVTYILKEEFMLRKESLNSRKC